MRIEEWLEREAVRWQPLIRSGGEREKESGARATGSVTDDLYMKSMKPVSNDDTGLSTKYKHRGELYIRYRERI